MFFDTKIKGSYKWGRKPFEDFFGKLNVITKASIVEYQSMRRGQGKSVATVNREIQYCHAAFERAGVAPNPFHKFDKFTEAGRTRYSTQAELEALMGKAAHSRDRGLQDVILTGLLTGLRKRRVLSLHRDDIDFDAGIIKNSITSNSTKGFNSIPLPEPLAAIFRKRLGSSLSGYIFENRRTQKPVTDVEKAFKSALKAAGIRNFRFHDLRIPSPLTPC